MDGNIALRLVEAVTATLVEGAERLCKESGDGKFSTQGVVLEDLIRGSASTTSDDAKLGVQTL